MPVYIHFLCCQQICYMNYIPLNFLLHFFIYCVYVHIQQHVWGSEDNLQVPVPSFHYVGIKLSQSCESCKC